MTKIQRPIQINRIPTFLYLSQMNCSPRLFIVTLLLLSSFFAQAQNGSTIIPMPGFFSSQVLRYKNCIAVDPAGKTWVGFRDIGICVWDGNAWTYYDNMNSGLPENNIKNITFDASGVAWIATSQSGIVRFDGFTWSNYTVQNAGLPSDKVNAILTDGNDVWLATHSGLGKLTSPNWNSCTVFNTGNSSIPSDSLNQLALSPSNELWVGSQNGVLQLANNVWTSFLVNGNPFSRVQTIYAHDDGSVWISDNKTVWKNTSAGFVPWETLFPSSILYREATKSICKGPRGGVVFASGRGQVNEILNNYIYTYYPTGIAIAPITPSHWFAYRASDHSLAMVSSNASNSPFIDLVFFNDSLYDGFGLGLTWGNSPSLDVNEVNALILNRGDMHWNTVSAAAYETPKGTATSPLFTSALWIGGLDSVNQLHQAAMTYRQNGFDFAPGPIDPQTGNSDSATAQKFDRIWKISRYEISEFNWHFAQGNVQNGTFVPSVNIIDWPALGNFGVTETLAPFIDVDLNGVYNPLTGGDYPDIKGDQMLFWVFNDQLITHTESNGDKFGVQVNASAWAYYCPTIADSDRVINYTTFYHYDIINRSPSTYHDVWLGLFMDVDLGYWQDDYIGCFPESNFGFVYNGDQQDDSTFGLNGYGYIPPVFGAVILEGPLATPNDSIDNNNNGTVDEVDESCLMTVYRSYESSADPAYGNPTTPQHFYNYLRGLWKDSIPITVGGFGYGGNTPSRFLYPGFPNDTLSWNETTGGQTPYDRKMMLNSGSTTLAAADTIRSTFALVYSRDTSLAWNSTASYQKVISDVTKIQTWHQTQSSPSCIVLYNAINEAPAAPKQINLFPNPTNNFLTLDFNATYASSQFRIYDVHGKLIANKSVSKSGQTSIETAHYAPGIYFVEIIDGENIYFGKFIRQ
jgi:hypothetical protein